MLRALAISSLVCTLVAGGLVAAPAAASADPVVVVRVRRAGEDGGEATVTLRDANGTEHRCSTEEGTCRMEGVPPGRFTVTTVSEAGEQMPQRSVVIPPDGKVTLVVAVP